MSLLLYLADLISIHKDAISDYFNTKYLREISQDQFKDLMGQIDEKIYKENVLETTLKTIVQNTN